MAFGACAVTLDALRTAASTPPSLDAACVLSVLRKSRCLLPTVCGRSYACKCKASCPGGTCSTATHAARRTSGRFEMHACPGVWEDREQMMGRARESGPRRPCPPPGISTAEAWWEVMGRSTARTGPARALHAAPAG